MEGKQNPIEAIKSFFSEDLISSIGGADMKEAARVKEKEHIYKYKIEIGSQLQFRFKN